MRLRVLQVVGQKGILARTEAKGGKVFLETQVRDSPFAYLCALRGGSKAARPLAVSNPIYFSAPQT